MRGARTFSMLMVTQVISLIGSGMTTVAVGIRIFSETGSSSAVLLVSFFSALPIMLAGSFAGVLVDRWDRRAVLVVCDSGQALGTLALFACLQLGSLQLWQLYAVAAAQGLLAALQRPAAEATVALLVPPAQLDRANVLRQLAGPAAGMVAPMLAGALYGLIGVPGIMLVDLATFALAVAALLRAHIPRPGGAAARASVWAEFRGGLQFLLERRTLLSLMIYAAAINFLLAGPIGLATPYVLVLTGSEQLLGVLLGLMNIGIVAGGALMAIWGGTRPRIHGIMLGLLFRAGWLALLGLARTPATLGLALFFIFFSNALVDASLATLMQLKVPAAMQGRVFALFFQLMFITNPLSLLLAGPLVDRVLEPAARGPGWQPLAPLLGAGPGSGMGALMLAAGSLMALLTALVYAHPATRHVERELPDLAEARG